MKRFEQFRKQFNPRFLLVRILVNAVVLFAVVLTPIKIERSLLNWLFLALMLGVLNAILRPILQFLTLSLVFVTYGIVLILINAVLLLILEWLFPARITIPSLFWALAGGAILGMTSSFLENLLGLTTPIVPESEAELRQRLERQPAGLTNFILTSATFQGEEVGLAAPVAPAAQAALAAPTTAPAAGQRDQSATADLAPAERRDE